MEPKAQIVKSRDGQERVLLALEDFQALLDACHLAERGPADLGAVVQRLAGVLKEPRADTVGLDEFLERYDGLHGQD